MNSPSSLQKSIAAALAAFCVTGSGQASADVEPLGTIEAVAAGTSSQGQGISADGSVIVGWGSPPGAHPHLGDFPRSVGFRWTAADGMKKLPALPGGGEIVVVEGVSADGRVTVGSSDTLVDGTYTLARAVRWVGNGPPQPLPMASGELSSVAVAASANGRVIVGYRVNDRLQRRAMRWQDGAAPRDLGDLGGNSTYASAVSNDGVHIAGIARNAAGHSRAFVWSESDGMRDIGTLPGHAGAQASAISANGNVVVGISGNGLTNSNLGIPDEAVHGFIWRRDRGEMVEITNPLAGSVVMPTSVSANGDLVVGVVFDGRDRAHAFRWRRGSGMQVSVSMLPTRHMSFIRGLSADGRYSAGRLESGAACRMRWR
jgi:probable HAF family extracellular repeat protein